MARPMAKQRYGRLTLIEYDRKLKRWKCKCECGSICYVASQNLISGNTQSCGCKYVDSSQSQIVEGTRITQIGLYDQGVGRLHKRNTSGYTGVYFNKRKNKWWAEIFFKSKHYFLGYYDDIQDAAAARGTAEKQMHGDFLKWYESAHNSPPKVAKTTEKHGKWPRYSKNALLFALKGKAKELGRTPYAKEMKSPSASTYIRFFGSWNAALVEAGLEQNRVAHNGIKCSFPECDNNATIKGYCRKHYYKLRRPPKPPKPPKPRKRKFCITDNEYEQIKKLIETIRGEET